jgi:hypothetical protein
MTKQLLVLAAAALSLQAPVTWADVAVALHEDFASSATFNGTLTFSDNFDTLKGVSGMLTGGPYGPWEIGWTYRLGMGLPATAQTFDSNPNTYEDWLMEGVIVGHASFYIGISWYFADGNQNFKLALSPDTDVLYAGIGSQAVSDPAVSYQVGAIPEPETYAMMLAGLGLLGFMARRRKQKETAAS